MRDAYYECARYACDDSSSIPFWLVFILLILLVILLVSWLAPPKDEPKPLKKAVDDVLKGYEDQAQTWGDSEAKTAFAQARGKVADVIEKYKSKPI